MPVTVKINPQNNTVQAHIIEDATPNNDGVMTALQAEQLAALVAGGGAGAGFPKFAIVHSTGAPGTSVDYGQLLEGDATAGAFAVSLPLASDGTTSNPNGNVWIIKNVGTANNVGLRLHVGEFFDGPGSLAPGQWAIYVSDGVSGFICVSTNADNLVVTAVQTAAYNASPFDVVRGDSTAGDIPVNLPSAAASPNAQIYVKAVGSANLVNITPAGGDTVEGGALLPLAPGESAILISDGVSNWMQF
jgi:hypothetical protein